MIDETWLLSRFQWWIPLVLSLTVHEWAHAVSAFMLGDSTAKDQGRLTLNPLAHIDPVGTLILPLIGVPFGWAKPVPVNIARFRPAVGMRAGVLLTAAAGPASNLLIVLASIASLILLELFGGNLSGTAGDSIRAFLQTVIVLNVLLATFNMLPIVPLDGSRIADALMPNALRPVWDAIASLGPLPLVVVCIIPLFTSVHCLRTPLDEAQSIIDHLVRSIAH